MLSKKFTVAEKNRKNFFQTPVIPTPEVQIVRTKSGLVDLRQVYNPTKFGDPSFPAGREICTQSQTIFPIFPLWRAGPY